MPPQPRIGRYALLGRVGRGGMGEVYRARAFGAAGVTKDLGIKRIRRSRLADPRALERFVDEARLWMRLSHGNIVPVFDFGRIENDYYLAMEWVDGCDLLRLLGAADTSSTPLEDEVVLFVGAEVARALAYLHDPAAHEGRAVAHCDLKPSNVLCSRSGEVKLADFGVAVALDSERAGGTRGYVPPTEAVGERVDARADLYALGRVLRDLLSAGGSSTGSDTRDAIAAIARRLEAEDPPSAKDAEHELEALLARARVVSGGSPRARLVARVASVPVPPNDSASPVEVATEASFLAHGDEASFLAEMRADAGTERTASTRHPQAPAARRITWPAVLAAFAIAAAALVFLQPTPELGSGPPPVPPAPRAESVSAVEPASLPTAAAEPSGPATGLPAPAAVATEITPPPARTARARAPRVEPPSDDGPAPTPEPAHLRVNARPWAEVTIDGVARGTTPLVDIELGPGAHRIELVHPPSGHRHEATIELAPGERRDIVVDLRT